jgi:alpha-beta hydrolase superfamily lysophospholipase
MHTTTLRMNDGAELALSDWPLAAATSTVLLVHGLGEHAGRYTHVAEWLNQQGHAVRAYDHYGHGHSSGPRGGLQRETQLLEHLAEVLAALRAERAPGHRITVLGHSLGGLVVSAAVARGLIAPEAMVLSSPALAVHMAAWQRAVVGWLPALWPNLTLGNALQPQLLSHDAAVVQAYLDDPLVHDRICARLGAFVASEGDRVLAEAPKWQVPTLLLYAGQDRLVNPAGSRAFAAAAPTSVVAAHCFDPLYHEIFNETDSTLVFAALGEWLRRPAASQH